MNCWEILGIAPTKDQGLIKAAFERQRKFATEEEADRLADAYRQILDGHGDRPVGPVPNRPTPTQPNAGAESFATDPVPDVEPAPMTETDHRVAREVAIQIRALLNDPERSQDHTIWRAILAEPPADRPAIREAVGEALESDVRPMAENGAFPAPVARFLADWFGWYGVADALDRQGNQATPELMGSTSGERAPREESEKPPQMTNFWPMVIGWIVGLAILASLFGGMGGG